MTAPTRSIRWSCRTKRAGQPADPASLVDVDALFAAYHDIRPDPADPAQRVAFGTSGHRGSAFNAAFNEAHILAITEAICRYRAAQGIDGPLFIGTRHARPVRAGVRDRARGAGRPTASTSGSTPTTATRRRRPSRTRSSPTTAAAATGLADGIVVTPSHNPPEDGGFKYNPPNGGPADTDVTGWIEDEANGLARRDGLDGDPRASPSSGRRARDAGTTSSATYVDDLGVGHRHGRDPRRPACASAWTRWAARASPTGPRSASATAWT